MTFTAITYDDLLDQLVDTLTADLTISATDAVQSIVSGTSPAATVRGGVRLHSSSTGKRHGAQVESEAAALAEEAQEIATEWRQVSTGWLHAACHSDEFLMKLHNVVRTTPVTLRSTYSAGAAAVTSAVETALGPLISFLTKGRGAELKEREEEEEEDSVKVLARRLYCQLLPNAMRVLMSIGGGPAADVASTPLEMQIITLLAQECSEADCAVSIRACAEGLLTPYITLCVVPLVKELRFHFHAGQQTAKHSDPRQLFVYLKGVLLNVLPQVTKKGAWEGTPEGVGGAFSFLLIGQFALLEAAVAVFVACYDWRSDSPLLRLAESSLKSHGSWRRESTSFDSSVKFVVVVINTVIDFVTHMEGAVETACLSSMARQLTLPTAMRVYLMASSVTAECSLRRGYKALWRRPFLTARGNLQESGLKQFSDAQWYCNSLHFVRCVEAFLRRMNTYIPLVDQDNYAPNTISLAQQCWHYAIEPSLSTFLRAALAHASSLEASEEDDDVTGSEGPWAVAVRLMDLTAGSKLVVAAAGDWGNMLLATSAKSEALRELRLRQQEFHAKTAALVEQLVSCVFASGAAHMDDRGSNTSGALQLEYLYRIESFLCFVGRFPDEHRHGVERVMGTELRRHLTLDMVEQFGAYTASMNLTHVVSLL